MRAPIKFVRLPQKLGVMLLFSVTSKGPKSVSTFKEGKSFPSILGINSCSTPTWVKVKATKKKVGIDYKGLPADVVPGDILLLDDGYASVKSTGSQGMKVFTEVTVGGPSLQQ